LNNRSSENGIIDEELNLLNQLNLELMRSENYPVMLTPFNGNNTIDIGALRELTEFYISGGSSGLFVNCLSGEMFQLNDEERLLITRVTVEQAKNRVPVVSTGTFGYNQKQYTEFIKAIYQTGVSAVVLNTNQIISQGYTDEKFKSGISNILDETGNIPLGLYECPEPVKTLLSPELTGWMAETGRFVYLKDTSCDLEQLRNKVHATEGTVLKIFNANIPTAQKSLLTGVSGISSIASNFYPELISYLVQNYDKNDEKTKKVNSFITVADTLLHQKYPFSAKYFLNSRGMKLNVKTRSGSSHFDPQDYLQFAELKFMMERVASETEIKLMDF